MPRTLYREIVFEIKVMRHIGIYKVHRFFACCWIYEEMHDRSLDL